MSASARIVASRSRVLRYVCATVLHNDQRTTLGRKRSAIRASFHSMDSENDSVGLMQIYAFE